MLFLRRPRLNHLEDMKSGYSKVIVLRISGAISPTPRESDMPFQSDVAFRSTYQRTFDCSPNFRRK